MIPLHLRSTTVHVTPEQAERLVAQQAAEWLPGVAALVAKKASDDEILSAAA